MNYISKNYHQFRMKNFKPDNDHSKLKSSAKSAMKLNNNAAAVMISTAKLFRDAEFDFDLNKKDRFSLRKDEILAKKTRVRLKLVFDNMEAKCDHIINCFNVTPQEIILKKEVNIFNLAKSFTDFEQTYLLLGKLATKINSGIHDESIAFVNSFYENQSNKINSAKNLIKQFKQTNYEQYLECYAIEKEINELIEKCENHINNGEIKNDFFIVNNQPLVSMQVRANSYNHGYKYLEHMEKEVSISSIVQERKKRLNTQLEKIHYLRAKAPNNFAMSFNLLTIEKAIVHLISGLDQVNCEKTSQKLLKPIDQLTKAEAIQELKKMDLQLRYQGYGQRRKPKPNVENKVREMGIFSRHHDLSKIKLS